MADTVIAQALTVDEALEILRSGGAPVKLKQLQPVHGHFGLVEAREDHGKVVNTLQQIGADGPNTIVRTEFRTSTPVNPAHSSDSTGQSGPSVSVELQFAVSEVFEFPPEESSEQRRTVFAKVNAVQHAWPYWRAFVQTSMSVMGLVPVVAPMLSPKQAAQMAGFRERE